MPQHHDLATTRLESCLDKTSTCHRRYRRVACRTFPDCCPTWTASPLPQHHLASARTIGQHPSLDPRPRIDPSSRPLLRTRAPTEANLQRPNLEVHASSLSAHCFRSTVRPPPYLSGGCRGLCPSGVLVSMLSSCPRIPHPFADGPPHPPRSPGLIDPRATHQPRSRQTGGVSGSRLRHCRSLERQPRRRPRSRSRTSTQIFTTA